MSALLDIRDLHATVDGKGILKGLSLTIKQGEIHAVMGPNGSGKSTLSYTLAGRPGYDVTGGEALFEGQNILDLAPEERAALGIFLAFQYPVEIPGVPNATFMKEAVNAVRKQRGEDPLDALQFMKSLRQTAKELGVKDEMLKRAVNSGFSGGEKKRNEILQMTLLKPRLAILDETDSGLDIDALKAVAEGVNLLRGPDRSMLIITHYQRLLDYIEPDQVHILADGKIVRSGDKSLAKDLEKRGYADVIAEAA